MTAGFIYILVMISDGEVLIVEQPSITVCESQMEYFQTVVRDGVDLECDFIEMDKVKI